MKAQKPDAKSIFGEASRLIVPAEREVYLERACAGDTALREDVQSLLDAYDRAGDFLDPTRRFSAPDFTLEPAGTMLGRYKLLQPIGEGGFGVVYLAEQTEPVQRKVALKIIKPGMDSKEVLARFETERQALALMDHPNIAKVLDGGVTNSGRPFFVMELVRGISITDYCDQQSLSTGERLRLFIQVCHAVQHAHQKGIIHRDLKPGNILVTLCDGRPVPKVIDFGVAKALGQKLTERTLFTAFEHMIGTPAYMSPEQATQGGWDIDTRSDVYSLGVLLYELLTGATPLDTETLRRSTLDEIRQIIRDTDPLKPSTRLLAMGDRLPDVARRRRAEPTSLPWLVRGDLDWITMKALEKDRQRRYETVSGLAMDLERHLTHEPVTARPPSTVYRLQKLVRRHRVSFVAGAVVAVTLLLGLVASTWQAARATRAERLARNQSAENAAVMQILEQTLARQDPGGERIRQSLLESVTQWLGRKHSTQDEKVVDFVRTMQQNLLAFKQPTLEPRTEDRLANERATNWAVTPLNLISEEQFRSASNSAREPLYMRHHDTAIQEAIAALKQARSATRVTPVKQVAQPLQALIFVPSPDQVEKRGVPNRRGLTVLGPQFLKDKSFENAVLSLFGNPITELHIVVTQQKIMEWCRNAGHPDVNVLIPEQEIIDGALQVAVVERADKRTRRK